MLRLKIKNILKDKMVFGTAVFTAVNLAGMILNYLVHPILARRLSVAEYGDFQMLLSLVAILGVIAGAVYTVAARETAVESAAGRLEVVELFRKRVSKILQVAGGVGFLLLLVSSPLWSNFFHISSYWAPIITSGIVLYFLPSALNLGVLAGLHKFSQLSLNTVFNSAIRFILVGILVYIFNWRLVGASIALALSGIGGLFMAAVQIRKLNLPNGQEAVAYSLRPAIKYSLLVLAYSAIGQLFFNLDILAAKAVLSPDEAGVYAGLLTVGRVIFFLGSMVPAVLFPMIASVKDGAVMVKYRILGKALLLATMLMAPAMVAMWFWPKFVVGFFLGANFVSYSHYLVYFIVPMLCLSVLMIFSQYFLALADRRAAVILVSGLLLEGLGLFFYHQTLLVIIRVCTISFALSLAAMLCYAFSQWRRDWWRAHSQ